LLGEEFGADRDFGLRRFVAGGEEMEQIKETKESKGNVRGAYQEEVLIVEEEI